MYLIWITAPSSQCLYSHLCYASSCSRNRCADWEWMASQLLSIFHVASLLAAVLKKDFHPRSKTKGHPWIRTLLRQHGLYRAYLTHSFHHEVNTLTPLISFDPLIWTCSTDRLSVESTATSCTDKCHDGSYDSLLCTMNSSERRNAKNPQAACCPRKPVLISPRISV